MYTESQKCPTFDLLYWCFVRATQSNCCGTLDFLSPEQCPTKAPSWMHCITRFRKSYSSM